MSEKTITLVNAFLFAFAIKMGMKTCDAVWDKYMVNMFKTKIKKGE